MADLQSIHLTSDSAVDTQQKLNSNFTEIEQRKVDNALKTGSEIEYKVLSDNNYTDVEKTKLSNIDENAEVNTIDTIKVNDVALTPTNKVVNITVPVNAGDIGALPDSTKYGATVDLSYTANTGVLGLSLKDQDGTELSSDTVDLPLELIIESGSVKTCTVIDTPVAGYVVGDKYIDLVLANGNHIYILVTDLIDQITINTTGTGNAVTGISINGSVLNVERNSTFVESEEIEFTDSDAGWGELDENGFYTLTKASTKTPVSNAKKFISGTKYSDVLATVASDGTNIYVTTDTKFSGKVIAI